MLDDPNMKDKLKAMVKIDPGVADVKDTLGRLAIDIAHHECKEAMESALRLFETYDVDDENPPLHKSRTACVLKAFSHEQQDEDTDVDLENKRLDDNRVPVALKCMGNFEHVRIQ